MQVLLQQPRRLFVQLLSRVRAVKRRRTKFHLTAETVRALGNHDLVRVAGGELYSRAQPKCHTLDQVCANTQSCGCVPP